MNNVVTGNFGAPSTVFANKTNAAFGDMAAGVSSGFATAHFKGKVWRVRHQGKEVLWTGADGQPAMAIECVIVNASTAISKQFYESGFAEDQQGAAPQCWSVNGLTPDPASTKKQHSSCISCPKNVFGSRISESGKEAKACQDRRRIAVIPISMVGAGLTGPFNGPILLQVPPTSLRELAAYANRAKSLGFGYYAVSTRIGFDLNLAYPKLTFDAVRALTDDEAEAILDMASSDYVQNMVNGTGAAPAPQAEPVADTKESFFTAAMTQSAPAPAKPAAPLSVVETQAEEPSPFAAAPAKAPRKKKDAVEVLDEAQAAAKPASGDLDAALNNLFGG